MAHPVWPNELPTHVLRNGYTPAPPNNIQRTPMERGFKQRRTATGTPEELSVTFRFTPSQYAIFKAFVMADLKDGSLKFTWPHPDDNTARTCQFVPENDRVYVPTRTNGAQWLVSAKINVWRAGL